MACWISPADADCANAIDNLEGVLPPDPPQPPSVPSPGANALWRLALASSLTLGALAAQRPRKRIR